MPGKGSTYVSRTQYEVKLFRTYEGELDLTSFDCVQFHPMIWRTFITGLFHKDSKFLNAIRDGACKCWDELKIKQPAAGGSVVSLRRPGWTDMDVSKEADPAC
jgi:WD40 repeat protein